MVFEKFEKFLGQSAEISNKIASFLEENERNGRYCCKKLNFQIEFSRRKKWFRFLRKQTHSHDFLAL
jgi:hypothetical protein